MRHYLPLFLVAGLAACAEEPAGDPMYESATVDRRTIEVSVSSAGVVEPLATVEVKSKASGEVLDVLVELGLTLCEIVAHRSRINAHHQGIPFNVIADLDQHIEDLARRLRLHFHGR